MPFLLIPHVPIAPAPKDDGTKKQYAAVKVDTAPIIDGDISDEVWQKVPEGNDFWYADGSTLIPERTFVRLAYDKDAIYVSFRCLEKPSDIVARETQEDAFLTQNEQNEDAVIFQIEPYMTFAQEDRNLFVVNPLGTKATVMAAGRANKKEWKGDWQAASKRTADGWTAEMRIPWRILRYPTGAEKTMAINFFREHAARKATSAWSSFGQPNRLDNNGRWTKVSPPAFERPKIELLPYILPGVSDKNRGTFRSGIDAKYQLTPDLVGVSSLNPDFGTIEGAVEGIKFSRSERFVQDTRPFFLEGRQYFQAGTDFDIGMHFYPRRIDRFDLGNKIYGKLSPKDSVGILNTVTFNDRTDLVGKWNHTWSADQTFNLFVATKDSVRDDGTTLSANYFQKWGKFNIDPRVAISNDNGLSGRAANLAVGFEDTHWFHYFAARDHSPDFRLVDGLQDFTGYKGFYQYENFDQRWKSGSIRHLSMDAWVNYDWHYDGTPFRRGANLFFEAETANDLGLELGGVHSWFDHLLDNYVHAGVTFNNSNRKRRFGAFADVGQISNMPYTFWGPNGSFSFGNLDTSFQSGFLNLGGHDLQSIITATYNISPTRSVGGRMVERNGDVNWYMSYRESAKMGLETYVILGDPNADKFRRIFQVKLVYPFRI